jgi:glycosyltransferase involved in cell wall biosynthesis
MRVAFVTAFPDRPEEPRGGVEAVSVHLVEALARLPPLDVHVITTSGTSSPSRPTEWKGATVHRVPPGSGPTLFKALTTSRRRVSETIARLAPDVVHAHDTFGIMVADVARPRVLTIHGFIHADTAVSGQRLARLRSLIWKRVETAAWARFPHIISISPYVRDRLCGLVTARVHDVENPVGLSFFACDPHPDAETIFSAAVVSRRKNTLALVEALAILHRRGLHARLRLAGAVKEPEYARTVRARVRDAGLDGHVTFLDGVKGAGVVAELERATVFALASLEENAPVGIQEAMAAGVPVVASNRCGMPYQVSDGATGFLVDPEDASDVARGLEEVLRDPGLRARMGAAARIAARARFHPDAVARQTAQVYEAAVAEGPVPFRPDRRKVSG